MLTFDLKTMKYIVLLLMALLISGCEGDKVIKSEDVEATIYRIREVKYRENYRELELKTNDETPLVKGIIINGQCKINPRVIGKKIIIKKELTSSGYINYNIPSEVSSNIIFTYCW